LAVVQEYWSGVLQRLQAEVDVFARLVHHYGEQGRENEVALSRLLEALVPKRFGVGTGMIIDSLDNYSRQTDIVVFDQADEPAMLAQTTQLLYPIESVLSCIEVKTTLRNDSIADCIAKKESLQTLQAARKFPDGASYPLFVVLAYNSALSPRQVKDRFSLAPQEHRPDLLCILDPGIIGGSGTSLQGAPHHFSVGLALLLEPEAPDTPPTYYQVDDSIMDIEVPIEGRLYPLVIHEGMRYLGDPARALLLFVEALVRRIAERHGRRDPVLTHYLDQRVRQMLWL
jgi:hypothetical protein